MKEWELRKKGGKIEKKWSYFKKEKEKGLRIKTGKVNWES